MSKLRNSSWLVSVGVLPVLLGVLLTACGNQNSNNNAQPKVFPMYNATYDAGQKAVTFHSQFKFGATPATWSSIQLTNGSVVKINDAQMKESSKIARIGATPEYGYDYTLSNVAPEALGAPYVFSYIDNDGRPYVNNALIPAPVTVQIPADFDRAQGLRIPWSVADQLAKNEIIRAQIQYPLSVGFYFAATNANGGDKSGTLIVNPAEFQGLQPGPVQITVCREKAADTVNAAAGGSLTTDYCVPVQTVNMK